MFLEVLVDIATRTPREGCRRVAPRTWVGIRSRDVSGNLSVSGEEPDLDRLARPLRRVDTTTNVVKRVAVQLSLIIGVGAPFRPVTRGVAVSLLKAAARACVKGVSSRLVPVYPLDDINLSIVRPSVTERPIRSPDPASRRRHMGDIGDEQALGISVLSVDPRRGAASSRIRCGRINTQKNGIIGIPS